MRALPHRPAHSSFISCAASAVLLCAAAWQPAVAQPLAADVRAPAAPPHYVPLSPLAGVEQSQTDWRAAHQAVGSFPRGHADIVAWEARHPHMTPSPDPHAGPVHPGAAHDHGHHHEGHQP